MSSRIPIRRVRADASIDVVGEYTPDARQLTLRSTGYPLLPPGDHPIDGDLPWVFEEMAPAGFIARRFTGWYPALALPVARHVWTATQVLAAISRYGHDLPGNLIVGEESYDRYVRVFASGSRPGPTREAAHAEYGRFVDDIMAEPGGSSLGGERPKFSLRLADGSGLLVKFTPPLETAAGRRWGDLLRMEQHAADTLRAFGVSAVTSRYVELESRGFLEVERFDRLVGGGRRGAVTLFWLGVALYGEAASAPAVAAALVADRHITADAQERLGRVHRFSAAIGNTDAHLGNYALVIDDDGAAALAPFYDITPMVFAPRHDELPDARVGVRQGPRDDDVAALVLELRARAGDDASISRPFFDAWDRHIGP